MKKKASIGCLFWVALILLVLVIFAFNKTRIDQVLEATGFTEIITQNQPDTQIIEDKPLREELDDKPPVQDKPVRIDVTERTKPEEPSIQEKTLPKQDDKPAAAEPMRNIRRAKLYFVSIEGETGILKGVIRPVYYADSPLTDTLNSLLRGPSSEELNLGLISVIPADTAIKSITIQNGVARIDLSESFRFNNLGREGYKLQLMQIVYTATEFSTVTSVQFLINGKVHTYLGPEGVYIGGPLSRSSF